MVNGSAKRVVKKPKQAGLSFTDALKKTKKEKAPAKSKSTVPVLEPKDKDVKQAVDAHVDAKARKKEAEADMAAAETTVFEFSRKIQDQDGWKGKFRTSYKVKGNEETVTYITQNRFSINSDDEDEIREILGEHFDECIETSHEVKLTKEFFENEELQKELMGMIGERFVEFFETVTSMKVKEDFNKLVYRILDEEGLENLRTFVRPYKASLR